MAFSLVTMFSCEKYKPGGTGVEQLAGDWFVMYQMEIGGEWYDIMDEYTRVTTYNTAANSYYEMFVDDHKNFWEYKVKTKVDPTTLKFGSDEEKDNYYYDSKVKVFNGQVFPGAGHSFSGVKTDSICFYVAFDDDDEPYATTFRVVGFRRTGFQEDEL